MSKKNAPAPKPAKKEGAPKKERKAPVPRLIKPQCERSLNGFTRALNSVEDSFAGMLPEGVMGALRATREQLASITAGVDPTARRARVGRPAVEFALGAEIFFTKAAHKSMKGFLDGKASFKGYAPNTKSTMAHVEVRREDGSAVPLVLPTAYLLKRAALE